MHARDMIERCHNSEIATHLLEGKVIDMIRDVAVDLAKLHARIKAGQPDHGNIQGQLRRLEHRIQAIAGEKTGLIDRYASGLLSEDAYGTENLLLDAELHGLKAKRAGPYSLSDCPSCMRRHSHIADL
jgi:hypothetical protein